MTEKLKYLAPTGKSRHSLLNFKCCCYTKSTKSRVDTCRYDKGHYEEMREIKTCRNWNEDFIDKSTEQCWAILEESTRNTSIESIQTFAMGSKTRKARPLWTNKKTITAVKRKSEACILYGESRDEQHYIEYRRALNRVRTGMRKAVRDFDSQIAREAKANPKAFYMYARSHMTRTMTETDVDKAEVLNSFFTSVFTLESLENIPTFDNRLHNTELTAFLITNEEVDKILKTLKTTKPPGPDGLHPRLQVELTDELVEPI